MPISLLNTFVMYILTSNGQELAHTPLNVQKLLHSNQTSLYILSSAFYLTINHFFFPFYVQSIISVYR